MKMKSRAEIVALRRQRLIARSIAQRAELTLQMQPLAHTLESVDMGLRIVSRIGKHPGWVAVLGLGLVMITPRRLSSFFRMGSVGLRMWRWVRPVLGVL